MCGLKIALRTTLTLTLACLFGSAPARAQSPIGAAIPGRYLVAFRGGRLPADVQVQVSVAGGRVVARQDGLGIAVVTGVAVAERLAASSDVEQVVADRLVQAHGLKLRVNPLKVVTTAADALYNSPQGWAVKAVGGTAATWAVSAGAGVRIAVLDSGVDTTHPDLAPNLVLNLSEIDQTALPSVCDDGTPQDQQGHGSWTASLAAGAMGPATGQMVGVAPAASILNIKVLQRMPLIAGNRTTCAGGQAYGLMSWVLQGINDAVAQHAGVVQMSLGTLVDITTGDGAGLKAMFDRVTYAAAQAGVVLVAAAGNDGFNLANPQFLELPAMARGVVAVVASTNPACMENLQPGATCVAGPVSVPYYSNSGAPLDAVAAPGGSYPDSTDLSIPNGWIYGACSSSGCFSLGTMSYVEAIGTSASAALAAGVAALLRGAHPNWDVATVVAALRASAPSAGVPVVTAATPVPASRTLVLRPVR